MNTKKEFPWPVVIVGAICGLIFLGVLIYFIATGAFTGGNDKNTSADAPAYTESYEDDDADVTFAPADTEASATEADETNAPETKADATAAPVDPDTPVSNEPTDTPEPTNTLTPTNTPTPTPTPTEAQVAKYRFRNAKLLNQHYDKHGIEMGFDSAESYEAAASAVITNPDALHKLEASEGDGDTCYYVEATNEFAILSADGYIRTYFLPSAGKKYYDKQ